MTEPARADCIVSGGTVLTMTDEVPHPDWSVVIEGSLVAAVGPDEELAGRYHADEIVDAAGCVVMPGLVNAHTHAAMSLFRGIADDLPLTTWLTEHIFPAEARNLTADFVATGTRLACAEMLLGGITTFCDMYLFEEAVARAAREMKMRGVLGEVLYDFPSPSYGELEAGWEWTRRFIETWRDDDLITPSVQPHALDTCSPELLQRARAMASEYGVPLIAHVAESRANLEHALATYGKRSFHHLEDLGVLEGPFTAVHAVHVDDAELEIMARHQVAVVSNPESNMKLASGAAPIHRCLERGLAVGIGTDGCASNNNLDLFGEMDSLAKLHKLCDADPTHLDAHTVVRLATVEGARAIGLGEWVGRLEPGLKADLIVIDFDAPHLTPCYDPVSHLVYAARASDVRDTMVNGEFRVRSGELVEADLEEIVAGARACAEDVRAGFETS